MPPELKCGIAGIALNAYQREHTYLELTPALGVPHNHLTQVPSAISTLLENVHMQALTSLSLSLRLSYYSLILVFLSRHFGRRTNIYLFLFCIHYTLLLSSYFCPAFEGPPPSRDPADLPIVCIPHRKWTTTRIATTWAATHQMAQTLRKDLPSTPPRLPPSPTTSSSPEIPYTPRSREPSSNSAWSHEESKEYRKMRGRIQV